MRIVFMGTPQFAVDSLDALINSKHEVVGVFTQPDKPKGRSKKLVFSPVKELAIENKIPVFQPNRLRKMDNFDELKHLNPDIIVVAAYGQILPKEVLELPKFGAINVHASILPRYRGAAPINYAIINGEKETGVTIMKMDIGLDTGDIIDIEKIEILESDTDESITKKLAKLGGNLLVKVLDKIDDNKHIDSIKQDDSKSTYAPMMDKSLGYIHFNKEASEIDCLIRGISVWPTATCLLNGKKLKIFMSHATNEKIEELPGIIVKLDKKELGIATKSGIIYFDEVQLEGKKRMDIKSFLLGNKLELGERFEELL